MKAPLLALFLLSIVTALAAAQSPATSTVTPADAFGGVVVCPDRPVPIPASIQTVTVRDAAGIPMPGVPVSVIFAGPIAICPGAVLNAVTNGAGVATFRMAAGGCSFGANAVSITANGISLRRFVVKSPDFDGGAPNLNVNLADLAAFAAEFTGGAVPSCHDYDNNGATNLTDLIVFGQAFANANHCP